MADYLHGVEQYFLENPIRRILVLAASTIGLVATADDADATAFPLNTPVLVNSYAFIAKAGVTGTLRNALTDIYDQVNALVVVIRVAEGADEAATVGNFIGTLDNETATFTGIKALLFAETLLGVRPRILIAPEYSHKLGVGVELESIAKKLNATPIVDGSGSGYSDVLAEKRAFDGVLFVNCGIKLVDETGTVVTRKASAAVAGHIVRVDTEEGYWHSPSNRKMNKIIGTSEPIDYAPGSLTSKANLYNSNDVCVIINKEGGHYFWGNTLANGKLLPHQRIRYIVGDSILNAHQSALDQNVTKQYVESVVNSVNSFLRYLKRKTVISGGKCWLDKELNIAAIGTRQVYFDYDLGFFDISERITFRQHVNDAYNEAVFS